LFTFTQVVVPVAVALVHEDKPLQVDVVAAEPETFNIDVSVSAQILCLSARTFCVAVFVEVVCNVYCMGAMQA
jgi:hypothetical protein